MRNDDALLLDMLIAARNVPVGGVADGTWDGVGIGSSTAKAHAISAGIEERAVAYAVNGDLPLGAYPTFGGQTVVDSTPAKNGIVCTGGINCSSGRELGDFQSVTIDNLGRADVTYMRISGGSTLTMFSRQS